MPLIERPAIFFDPNNTDHVLAARMAMNGHGWKYKFHLEEGYTNVLQMALNKMAAAWMDEVLGTKNLPLPRMEPPVVENNVITFRASTSKRGAAYQGTYSNEQVKKSQDS